jgi:hypothetical protein
MGIFNFQRADKGAPVPMEENAKGVDFLLDLGKKRSILPFVPAIHM